jgi:hypothetical protein
MCHLKGQSLAWGFNHAKFSRAYRDTRDGTAFPLRKGQIGGRRMAKNVAPYPPQAKPVGTENDLSWCCGADLGAATTYLCIAKSVRDEFGVGGGYLEERDTI